MCFIQYSEVQGEVRRGLRTTEIPLDGTKCLYVLFLAGRDIEGIANDGNSARWQESLLLLFVCAYLNCKCNVARECQVFSVMQEFLSDNKRKS
jgi:hypothetical protein